MVDLAAISSAIASLKTATEILQGINELNSKAEIQSKVVELNALIMSAQAQALAANSEQFKLMDKVRELEAQAAKKASWDKERSRYKLSDYGCGTFAYELKESEANGDPIHRLCVNCFEAGKKSILQHSHEGIDAREYMNCRHCGEVALGCPRYNDGNVSPPSEFPF